MHELRTTRRAPGRVHRPALMLAVPVMLGILLDRIAEVPWNVWMTSGVIASLLGWYGVATHRSSVAAFGVLVLFGSLAGARHHEAWWLATPHNIAAYADTAARPVRLRGEIGSLVTLHRPTREIGTPDWMLVEESRCELRCTLLQDGDRWIPVESDIWLKISGQMTHVGYGDRVEVVGRLWRPDGPRNPGEFDFREYLRNKGIDALVGCRHPKMVEPVPRNRPSVWFSPALSMTTWGHLQAQLRGRARTLLSDSLGAERQDVGRSLLLGDRSALTYDHTELFIDSGTMHLLAISGLHVGILVGAVLVLLRLLHVSRIGMCLCLMATLGLYLTIAEVRAPIVRASTLAVVAMGSQLFYRVPNGINTLSVAALVTLWWKPTDLFDTGAQLSFLAVAAIIWSDRMFRIDRRRDPLDEIEAEVPRWREWTDPVWRFLKSGYRMTAAIWFVTLPLTMSAFNVLVPIGFVINVLLIPLVTGILWIGYLLLAWGLMLPGETIVQGLLGGLLDRGLWLFLTIVDLSRQTPFGKINVPSLKTWWLFGFYGWLVVASGLLPIHLPKKRHLAVLGTWIALGLAVGLVPASRRSLDVTFLATGHGNCVVIESPTGETLLYDGGTFGHGRGVAHRVQDFVISRGGRMLDAVIVSHADVDHFNGVPPLLENLPVGSLMMHRSFLDFEQPAVVGLCDVARREQVPIRFIGTGDQLVSRVWRPGDAAERVSMRVLHPPHPDRYRDDNANSIVLEIGYAGRRLLLTGDVEGEGLERLLSRWPDGSFDVLMSPHHGAASANPEALFAWAQPKVVVVSTGRAETASRIRERLDTQAEVYSTAEHGAVTISITPEGELTVETFLDPVEK